VEKRDSLRPCSPRRVRSSASRVRSRKRDGSSGDPRHPPSHPRRRQAISGVARSVEAVYQPRISIGSAASSGIPRRKKSPSETSASLFVPSGSSLMPTPLSREGYPARMFALFRAERRGRGRRGSNEQQKLRERERRGCNPLPGDFACGISFGIVAPSLFRINRANMHLI